MNEQNRTQGHWNEPERPPASWDPDRDPMEELAGEYAERLRRGERVSLDEYVRRYPQWATMIQELFPAVSAMERLSGHTWRDDAHWKRVSTIEQLGDYRILSEIARGGMGVIYEAEQVTLGRRVAIKVLPQQTLRSPRDVQRFQREAQTASRLHHTNIVPVFGVGEQNGHHYIVMQLIRGVGLDEIIAELRRLVAGNGRFGDLPTDQRSTTVTRSAVGLLEDTLAQKAPQHVLAATHVRGLLGVRATGASGPESDPPASPPAAHQIRAVVGPEYYRNVARMGLQAAQALSYAHLHAILHRDVKPGNLLLDEDGVVWMADFGLAKIMSEGTVTHTGDIVGTLGYMAPERFEGIATEQSDIYSLGLTLHELLTFDRAFDGSDRVSVMHQVTTREIVRPRTRNPDVPRDLETIVLKATARLPSDRYQRASELASDLEDFLADRPIKTRRMSPQERLQRWCRRNPAVSALAASVLVLLGVVGAMLGNGYVQAKKQQERAEATSELAVTALDEIYAQFAPARVMFPKSGPSGNEAEALLESGEMPLSKDVALLLENLLHFYDELSHEASRADEFAAKSMTANRRVADIRRRLGEFELARDSYQQAVRRFANLSTQLQSQSQLRLEYARIQNGLGIALEELNQLDQAAAAHEAAIAQFDDATSRANERFELARSLYLLHLVNLHDERKAKMDQSDEDSLKRAVRILDDLQQRYPDVSEYRFLLARCWLACKSGCNSDGTLNSDQVKAIDILEGLVDAAPDVADYRYELGEAYRSIEGRELWRRRDKKRPADELAKSEARLLRALELTRDLDTKNPNIPQYVVLKKNLHHILGAVLRDQNRLEEARQQFALAADKQRQVVQQSREPRRQEIGLYHVELEQAQLLRDLKQDEEATRSLHRVVAGLEQLLREPAVRQNRGMRRSAENLLRRSYVTLGCVLNRAGDRAAAESVWRKAEKPSG